MNAHLLCSNRIAPFLYSTQPNITPLLGYLE